MRSWVTLMWMLAGCFGPHAKDDDVPPDPPAARCGDGNLDEGEVCDDGNTAAGDGCRADCAGREACGDGMLDGGELCDDGNLLDGDACTASCGRSTCGDGSVAPGELCWGPLAAFPVAHGHDAGAVADLDGDGNLDSISAGDRRLSILFGDGRRGFGPSYGVVQPLPYARAVLAFDADRDGDTDLAVIGGRDQGQRGVALLSNDGTGKRFATQLVALEDWPEWAIPADLDGDGDVDLVVHTYSEPKLLVATNDGGRFAIASATGLELGGRAPVVVDLDRDGDLDLAYLSREPTALETWINQGGTLSRRPRLPVPKTTVLFVIDANHDAHPDLFASGSSSGSSSILVGKGDGTFSVTASAGPDIGDADAGDLDGDGDLDLVGLGGAYYNAGNFSFPTSAGFTLTTESIQPRLADLDGDRDPDLVVGGNAGSSVGWVHALENVAGKLVRPEQVRAGGYPGKAILAADLQAGGPAELVTLESDFFENEAELAVYAKTPGMRAFTRTATFVGGIGLGLAVADITGDSKPDAIVVLRIEHFVADTYELRVYPGNGAGGFGAPQILALARLPQNPITTPITGDVDADGDTDIAFIDVAGIQIARTVGGKATAPTTVPASDGKRIALADLDTDGDLDLVVSTSADTRVYTNSAGAFTAGPPIALVNARTLEPIDLDRDGDLDLVTGGFDPVKRETYFGVLRNTGGVLAPEVTAARGTLTQLVPVDIDRDGDVDVVASVDDDHSGIRIYRNTGGALAPGAMFAVGRDPSGCAVVDLDGDGVPELAASNTSTRHLSVLWSRP